MKKPVSFKDRAEPAFFSTEVASARRFYLNLNPPPDQSLSVVCGGFEHCAPNYAIHRPTFPFYAIEYVARGVGALRLDGKRHHLEPGTIFSYGPGVRHDITSNAQSPFGKYFVTFSGRNAVPFLKSFKLLPGHAARVFPPNALATLFDELIQCGLSHGRGTAELCVKLLECLALKIAGVNAPLKSAKTLAFATYQQCRRHIEQNFLKLRTLEQVACECHVNKAYLCRLFRRHDIRSPYQYLLRLKMSHAAERLRLPGCLVKQAAEEIGFADPFHFSRVFRSVLGVSPAKFRNLR